HLRRIRPAPGLPRRARRPAGRPHAGGGRRGEREVPGAGQGRDRGIRRRRPDRGAAVRTVHSGRHHTVTEAVLPPTPPLGWSRLRRSAHRRTDDGWLADAWGRSQVLVVDRDTALATDDALVLMDAEKAPEGERLFLGE